MHLPENFKLKVKNNVFKEISTFYKNVGLNYHNSYGREEIKKLILTNLKKPERIDNTNLISDPILDKWKGMGRIVIGKWHFAIDIKGNKVIVADACHEQNMTNQRNIVELFEEDLNTPLPRITNISLAHTPGNPYYIRAKVDGEWAGIRKITEKEYYDVMSGKLDSYKLAEKYFAKELAQERFGLDDFLNKGQKI